VTIWYYLGFFALITCGVGFLARKLEEISEQLRAISAMLQSWDRKKDR
jgi:hypothetical protein